MNDAPLNSIYEGSDLETLSVLRRYQQWIVDTFKPYIKGRAVEFGAGIGNISILLRPLVDSLDLVEPSINLGDPLRHRFKDDPAIKVYPESMEIWLPNVADASYESVTLVNVLEHIEDDVAALDSFMRILKPEGHLLLFVPALRFLFSDLDTLHGHYRRYHLDELDQRVRAAGFKIVKSHYFDVIGVLPWWLIHTKMGATDFSPFVAKVYDILFVPLSRILENVIKPPLGKNILIVARKPE